MQNNTFWNDKVVAVTGSSGFVGSAIVAKLREQDVRVIEVSRRAGVDIHNFPQLLEALQPANYIISTAAIDGNTEFKVQNSSYILEENVKIVSSVLAAASQLKIFNMTIVSSAAVYGASDGESYREDYDLIQHGGEQLGGYAVSKRVTELFAQQFSHQYGGTVLIPRPTNIYGNQDPHLRVIETLTQKIRQDQEIQIYGDGSELRSFIYLDDFVNVLLELIALGVSGPINIAGPEQTKVIELATLIARQLRKEPKLSFVHQDRAATSRVLDTTRLESLISYTYTSLEEGIAKSIS